jgi:hypothetical protein
VVDELDLHTVEQVAVGVADFRHHGLGHGRVDLGLVPVGA